MSLTHGSSNSQAMWSPRRRGYWGGDSGWPGLQELGTLSGLLPNKSRLKEALSSNRKQRDKYKEPKMSDDVLRVMAKQ